MRSTFVSPSATRPAMTRPADARRSVAITLAPWSRSTPRTTALLPWMAMSAPSRCSGEVGAGLDAVGHDGVFGAAQRAHTFDADDIAARAFDTCAHRDEAACK